MKTILFLSALTFASVNSLGADWDSIPGTYGTYVTMRGVHFINSDTGFITASQLAGDGGEYHLLKTMDKGASFDTLFSSVDWSAWGALTATYFFDDTVGFVVGKSVYHPDSLTTASKITILGTNDGGATWTERAPLFQADELHDIYFPSDSIGYAVGSDGLVLRTTNGGGSFVFTDSFPTNTYIKGVHFLNNDTGFVCDWYGNIYRTENRGDAWTTVFTGGSGFLEDIDFYDDLHGVVVGGSGGLVIFTEDGGNTWTSRNIPLSIQLNAVRYQCGGVVYTFGGSADRTWYSLDSGMNWTTELLPSSSGDIFQAAAFPNNRTGYIVGTNGTIITTMNADCPTEPSLPTAPVLGLPPENGINVPTSINVDWTGAAGATSYDVQFSLSSDFSSPVVDSIDIPGPFVLAGLSNSTTYYWRVRGSNSAGDGPWSPVWSFTTEPGTGVIPPTGNENDFVFKSGSIYYHLSSPAFVSIELFDLSGKRIQSWVNQLQKSGHFVFPMSQIPSGTYQLRFEAGKYKRQQTITFLSKPR